MIFPVTQSCWKEPEADANCTRGQRANLYHQQMKVIGVVGWHLWVYIICVYLKFDPQLVKNRRKEGVFFAPLTCFIPPHKASWRTWPRQWPAVVWPSLQCSWTKSTKDSVQNSSTAMRKTHCRLSLNYSCVCQRWHNQLVGLEASWSILVLNDSLSSTNQNTTLLCSVALMVFYVSSSGINKVCFFFLSS